MEINKRLAIETAIKLIYDTYFHVHTKEDDKCILYYL